MNIEISNTSTKLYKSNMSTIDLPHERDNDFPKDLCCIDIDASDVLWFQSNHFFFTQNICTHYHA